LQDRDGACADWIKAIELGNSNAAYMLENYCHIKAAGLK